MLTISRLGRAGRRYAVEDDRGPSGTWERRRFDVDVTGELDGRTYALSHHKRTEFFLTEGGTPVATARHAGRRRWTISAGAEEYELRQPSMWREAFELSTGGATVGTVRRARTGMLQSQTVCDLPAEIPPPVQAFIGFVVMALWMRAASDASAGVV